MRSEEKKRLKKWCNNNSSCHYYHDFFFGERFYENNYLFVSYYLAFANLFIFCFVIIKIKIKIKYNFLNSNHCLYCVNSFILCLSLTCNNHKFHRYLHLSTYTKRKYFGFHFNICLFNINLDSDLPSSFFKLNEQKTL